MKKYKVCIWGTGNRCKTLLLNLPDNFIVTSYIDTLLFAGGGTSVYGTDRFLELYEENDLVIVTPANHDAIRDFIQKKIGTHRRVFYMCDERPIRFYQPYKSFNIMASIDELADDIFMSTLESSYYNDYVVCDVGTMRFLINSCYTVILDSFLHGRVFQQEDIYLFFELIKKYYPFDDERLSKATFWDIGGNIGTTSLFAKKMIYPKMKIIAFEPVKENCRQFAANVALNDLALGGDVVLVPVALSDENGHGEIMLSHVDNLGDNRVVKNNNLDEKRTRERISNYRLDDWLAKENKFSIVDSVVWMDVQAHEGFVLEGGRKFFTEHDVPLYMEVWPKGLKDNDSVSLLMDNLRNAYKRFIYIDGYEKDKEEHEIEELLNFIESPPKDYFDIFLIK